MATRLILGSTSKYKRQLLEQAGYKFVVEESGVDESVEHKDTVVETVQYLAEQKARAILAKHTGEDVVVVTTDVDGEIANTNMILGKPESLEQAEAMLLSYSEQVVYIWCATTIASHSNLQTHLEKAELHFAKLDPAEVHDYVQTMQPTDKGGAIAIEEIEQRGWLTSITGDREAIIGVSVGFVKRIIG